jgi:Tol biopolymer transport system component
MNGSASFPKTSPDGKYLLFTEAAYGTFPIWHREADLRLLNLETNEIDLLKQVNDTCSDSYHSWSSNSHWFTFASKRDDGIYGKPYFTYINNNGKASKPFVLPQKDPEYYDNTLKSFNIPELSKGKTLYDARDIEKIYQTKAITKVF